MLFRSVSQSRYRANKCFTVAGRIEHFFQSKHGQQRNTKSGSNQSHRYRTEFIVHGHISDKEIGKPHKIPSPRKHHGKHNHRHKPPQISFFNQKDVAGEYKEKTQWHNIVCWGKLGDLVEKMVFKGSSLFIEGEVTYRIWEDQNGVTKSITEINGNNFQILGTKANEQKRDQNQSSSQADYNSVDEDDDLPF